MGSLAIWLSATDSPLLLERGCSYKNQSFFSIDLVWLLKSHSKLLGVGGVQRNAADVDCPVPHLLTAEAYELGPDGMEGFDEIGPLFEFMERVFMSG
jgi:hypothetical protein